MLLPQPQPDLSHERRVADDECSLRFAEPTVSQASSTIAAFEWT
jgi:hypothetical protein